MIQKLFWVIRALVYKPFFGKFGVFSYIGKPLYINNFKCLYFGSKVRIFPHARFEVLHNSASIVLEDNISIGQNLHVISGGNLVIRSNTTISANVLITNIDHSYQIINTHIMKQPLVYKETQIHENCFIGYGAVIQAGTTLGKQCIVGANAVVKGTFPPYCVIVGVPAIVVKRYDEDSKSWKKTSQNGEFIDEQI